jgi:hypothetical protein
LSDRHNDDPLAPWATNEANGVVDVGVDLLALKATEGRTHTGREVCVTLDLDDVPHHAVEVAYVVGSSGAKPTTYGDTEQLGEQLGRLQLATVALGL